MIRQFHHSEFLPLDRFYEIKKKKGITISLVIPTYNEVSTVGDIIRRTKLQLIDKLALLDEIVVMDGNSSDGTAQCAKECGAKVYQVGKIGDTTVPPGKGTALWKSLGMTNGDIIACIDADIKNYDERFVYGLIAPLLFDENLKFIKGYYKRPMIVGEVRLENFGGRVTELMVRPLLATFYPELARLYQPLAGEYSFRRDAVSTIPFYSGYGVEIGLVFDIYKKYGLSAMAQVDMDIRCHRNRAVADLGRMSFGILQVVLKKLQQDKKLNITEPMSTVMVSPAENHWQDVTITEQELPPFIGPKGDSA